MSWESFLGFAGIVIGGILSFYFYRKSLPIRIIRWAIRNNLLIQDNTESISDVSIRYKKQSINTLSVSQVLVWNGSNTTIEKSNIAEANPLGIRAKNGIKLLDVKVLSSNNDSSQFVVSLEKSQVLALITFDYLDKGQGAVLQIIHTGKSSDDIEITGDIKGGTSPRKVKGLSSLMSIVEAFYPFVSTFGIMYLFAFIVIFVDQTWNMQLKTNPYIWVPLLIILPIVLALGIKNIVITWMFRIAFGFPKKLGNIREFIVDK